MSESFANTNETSLFLIDNNCVDLNIKNIKQIIQNDFSHINNFKLNDKFINKNDLFNYIPIQTSFNYLNLTSLKFPDLCSYTNVIFLSSQQEPKDEIKLVALFYRIFTGKSLVAFVNGQWKELEQLTNYFPFFLNIYQIEKCKQFKLNEIKEININNIQLKEDIIKEINDSKIKSFNGDLNIEKYSSLINYMLNSGKDWQSILTNSNKEKDKIKDFLLSIESKCFKNIKFKYYDAVYSNETSLVDNLQITLPHKDETKLHVYKTNASDYNFRNLKFKNVALNTSEGVKFVVPFYENEQTTRQTIRFLIMMTYNVHNSSNLIDLIVIYLYIKVSLLNDQLIKTRFENITRLFLKRHIDVCLFLKSNRKLLLRLKNYFKELNNFVFKEDLYCLFDDFIKNDLKLKKIHDFIQTYQIVYEDEQIENLNENQLEILPEINRPKCQTIPIEINETNWPMSKNFKCDDVKLQFNSSLPYFICVNSYKEFIEKINNISWMKTLIKLSDKFILKGGALVDLLSDREPHDYDLMNVGLSNEEFLYDFWPKFVDELKPKSIEFNPYPVTTFKLKLSNNDLIEIVLNAIISRDHLCDVSNLPDQICYFPREQKLYANEYTLWALNYGYCELALERHPKVIRLSHKLNRLGFNFYYNEIFLNKTKFLKERLERYVWVIEDILNGQYGKMVVRDKNRAFDFDKIKDNISNEFEISVFKNVTYVGKKKLFPNVDSFISEMESKVNENKDKENDLRFVEFNGAVVLPEKKNKSAQFSNALDWSI